MKKTVFIALACLMATSALTAQTVGGKVIDEQNQPIEFANVALYSLPDSTLKTGTVTDAEGRFSLAPDETGADAYLQISFIGYQAQTAAAAPQQTIVLKAEATELGEVVVRGNLPVIRIKNDALITTVQNSVLSKAGTGNDVLQRLPSLTGGDGAFSVFGKGEAKIYINNREMRDPSELDRLNSADIRDVEIVNNPGARYDASVKAIIRINTVRKTGDGFGFDVRSSYYQSQNTDLREQLNINFRKNGWDVFGTVSYNQDMWMQDSKMRQKTYVDTLWTQENDLHTHGTSRTLTGIAGLNYEFSPKHYAGVKYTLTSFPKNDWFSTLNSTVHADGAFYDKWNSVETKFDDNLPAHRLNTYYNGNVGELKIDFNADYYGNQKRTRSTVAETSQEYDNRVVTAENRVENRLWASKLVFTHPVWGGNLSAGTEYTDTRRTDEYANAEHIVPSSNTIIRERNNAFFAEYSRMTPIGQVGAGLRYENVCSDYFSDGRKMDEQSRRYGQWFPNFSFATQLKDVQMQLSYTAKTRRPTYRQLSNNVLYGNRLTLQTGNPFLKPSVTHDVTLVGAWKFVQLMASYSNEKNAIMYWTEQMAENPAVSVIAYRNLENRPVFSAFLTLSPKFGVWSPQLSGGFSKQRVTITSNNQAVKLNKAMPFASFNNSFSLPNGFAVTLDARFQGKGDYQNVHLTENQYIVNAGISKSFLNESLRVELKGHDVFYGKKDGNLLYNHQMELFQLNGYDSREVELTVRYRFNSAKSKYKGTGAGDSEMNRLR